MDNNIKYSEAACTFEDAAKLETMMCKSKSELRVTGMIILVLSVLLPFLPAKYSGQKAMLDIMSYSSAVAGIVSVLGAVFLWTIYFMLYGLQKDLKQKIKICVNTYITSAVSGNYRGREYYYFSAAGLPYRISRIPVTKNDFGNVKKGSRVFIEYSKYGKKLLGFELAKNN